MGKFLFENRFNRFDLLSFAAVIHLAVTDRLGRALILCVLLPLVSAYCSKLLLPKK